MTGRKFGVNLVSLSAVACCITFHVQCSGQIFHCHVLFTHSFLQSRLTCEVGEAQIFQATVTLKVMEDRKGPFLLIQAATTDHSELVQRQPAELVHSNEDVSCDFSDTLKEKHKVSMLQ